MRPPTILCGTFGSSFDFSVEKLQNVLDQPPGPQVRQSVNRYQRLPHRWISLLGKKLLFHAVAQLSLAGMPEFHWQVNPNGRPSLPGYPDFNLSHSDKIAICAIGNDAQKVGADIQRTKHFRQRHLEQVFSPVEQNWINGSAQRASQLWTRKEALSKLLGLGMRMDYRQLDTLKNSVEIQGEVIHLFNLPVAEAYHCSVAINEAAPPSLARFVWDSPGEPLREISVSAHFVTDSVPQRNSPQP